MITSLHNHSTWSDGKATVKQMLAMASELGIDELGIADHFVLRPDGEPPFWSIPADRLDAYVDELVRLQSGAGPTLRIAIEVDWFPNNAEVIAESLQGLPFDHIIGSLHEIGTFVLDASAEAWRELNQEQQDHFHRRYWQRLPSLAASGLFDIVGHLDLPKKFGGSPSTNLDKEINTALDAVAAAGLVVELNTAGWHWPCQDAYPSLELLQQCRERGIPTMLTADAHSPDHLLRDFSRGCERLRAAGYQQIVRFENREKVFYDLPAL